MKITNNHPMQVRFDSLEDDEAYINSDGDTCIKQEETQTIGCYDEDSTPPAPWNVWNAFNLSRCCWSHSDDDEMVLKVELTITTDPA